MPLDPDLALPSPPRDVPTLDAPSDLLVHAGPAVRRPFVLTSPQARVTGDEVRGIRSVELEEVTVLTTIRGVGAPASNVLIGPREIRREMLSHAGTVLESVVLGETLPVVVIEWTVGGAGGRGGEGNAGAEGGEGDAGAEGGEGDAEAEGGEGDAGTEGGSGGRGGAGAADGQRVPAARPTFRLQASSARYRTHGPLLRADASAEGQPPATTLVLVDPPPSRWSIVEEAGGILRVEPVPPPHAPRVTLVVLRADPGADLGALLAAAARTHVHQARAEAALRTQREEGLSLATGVPELDDGLAWAVARLEDRRVRRPAVRGSPLLPRGLQGALSTLALTVTGSPEAAFDVAERLDPDDPATFIARAWLAGWTGAAGGGWSDPEALRARIAALETVERPATGTADTATTHAAMTDAAMAAAATLLEIAGDRSGAAKLREARRPRRTGLRLPVVGPSTDAVTDSTAGATPPSEPPPERHDGHEGHEGHEGRERRERHDGHPGRLLQAFLATATGDAGPPPTLQTRMPRTDLERGLLAWTLLSSGVDPDRGYLLLRELLARGFRDMAGAWPAPEGSDPLEGPELPTGSSTPEAPGYPDDPAVPSLIPPALLCGLLGARPDAPVHRLRLAPVLPLSWTSFRITGVPLGDARLELAYSVEGRHRTFVLRPTAGRMPVTVVFEPAVPGLVDRVLVDGRPSDAEVVGRGRRTGTRLQIPVDRERSVTLVEADD